MIDTNFDFYSDTSPGKDPDSWSPTLKKYHQILWSKALPDGTDFTLSTSEPRSYLYHTSARGEFHLSSDAIGHTYRNWKSLSTIIAAIPSSTMDNFFKECSTIGAYIVFPARTINRQQNINMARGTNHRIKDRFDLTLECIRLHYIGLDSPLTAHLARYSDFFELFETFEGYVDFFLLDDLLSDDTRQIKFFLPFTSFNASPIPSDVPQYYSYMLNMRRFVRARNQRIAQVFANPQKY